MSGQSTRPARLIGWFRDVKTLPKLLLGFGGIGWPGMQSLRATLVAMLIGSTVILAKVGTLISNAGLYHSAVVRVDGFQRKEDFEAEIRPPADLKKKMLESLQEALATAESDGTVSLQQVPEDVRTIQAVLAPYLTSAETAVSILKDSFSETQTEEQRCVMRNLGTLAVAVEVDTVPEIRTLSKDQFLPAPTGTGKGAFPCVEGGQTRGSVTRGSGNLSRALAF